MRAVAPDSMAEGGGGVLRLHGASRRLGLGDGQRLVMVVLVGVSPPGEMVLMRVCPP